MKYQVQVHSCNSWNSDGSPIIECDCGHSHRTLSGAYRCIRKLSGVKGDGLCSARWYHAKVFHLDGTKLNEEEENKLFDLDCLV